MNYIYSILKSFGVDRAIAYTLMGRIWNIAAGLITLIFVIRYFSVEQQGFYYTFTSILAIQILFELGLSYVVVQYASHEKARLDWTPEGMLKGDNASKSRLHSLFRFSTIWYSAIAVLIFLVLLPGGLFFFSKYQASSGSPVFWRGAWCWAVLFTALNLIIIPIFAILEGCGLVSEVALMRLGQFILSNLAAWMAFYLGWGLLVLAVLNGVRFFWGIGWLILKKRLFIKELFLMPPSVNSISWSEEIWPFQWKIAISWLSGYLIFQLFNPVLFAYHGAVIAGQMGMSITIATALSTVSLAWVNTKAPLFGILVANKNFKKLDDIFFLSLKQSLLVIAVFGLFLCLGVFYLQLFNHKISTRIIGTLPFALFIGSSIINHAVCSEAIYLRAHKQEPFLGIMVMGGFLMAISTFYLGRFFGVMGMVSGYFLISAGIACAATVIFIKKRKLWHSSPINFNERTIYG